MLYFIQFVQIYSASVAPRGRAGGRMAAGAEGAGPVSHLGGVRSSGFRSFVGGVKRLFLWWFLYTNGAPRHVDPAVQAPPTPGGRRRVQVCKSFAPQRYSLMFL